MNARDIQCAGRETGYSYENAITDTH